VLRAPICFVTLRKLRLDRLCRLKLPFAVKVDADFRFEIGIASDIWTALVGLWYIVNLMFCKHLVQWSFKVRKSSDR
jgi:hypothetical protein